MMGIEEGTCWDEHWVLYGNQFDNKFHIKNNNKRNSGIKEFLWTILRLPYHCPTSFPWAPGCCFLNFPFDMGCIHSAKSHFINAYLNAGRKFRNDHFA